MLNLLQSKQKGGLHYTPCALNILFDEPQFKTDQSFNGRGKLSCFGICIRQYSDGVKKLAQICRLAWTCVRKSSAAKLMKHSARVASASHRNTVTLCYRRHWSFVPHGAAPPLFHSDDHSGLMTGMSVPSLNILWLYPHEYSFPRRAQTEWDNTGPPLSSSH